MDRCWSGRSSAAGSSLKIAVKCPVTVTNIDLAMRAAVDRLGVAYVTRVYADAFLAFRSASGSPYRIVALG